MRHPIFTMSSKGYGVFYNTSYKRITPWTKWRQWRKSRETSDVSIRHFWPNPTGAKYLFCDCRSSSTWRLCHCRIICATADFLYRPPAKFVSLLQQDFHISTAPQSSETLLHCCIGFYLVFVKSADVPKPVPNGLVSTSVILMSIAVTFLRKCFHQSFEHPF